MLYVGFTVTRHFSHDVFHFSSTEGKCWILMKRMIIDTTVRLPNERPGERQHTVTRQDAKSENVYASFTSFCSVL